MAGVSSLSFLIAEGDTASSCLLGGGILLHCPGFLRLMLLTPGWGGPYRWGDGRALVASAVGDTEPPVASHQDSTYEEAEGHFPPGLLLRQESPGGR